MTDNMINGNVTIPENAGPTVLAGRYRVVRQLGQGGMGSVWLAEDTKLDGRKVAIKMLPSILVSNKRAYAQVKQEALVSLKLSHPNIATVRAFEEESGSPFLVMDYIEGQTLDDYLAEHCVATASSPSCPAGLPEAEVIRLLEPVAAALDYAHAQGVVHRDVKPGNVMIRKDGVPFVLDFGIAREIQETMTRVTGKLSSGTLMYMSPEQLNGAAPKPAQDVYSFAAMVYECLTGHPPFSRGQIEYQIVNNTPELLGPQFAKCGSGVMAGLAKTPEARPATCAAVLSVGARVPRDRPSAGGFRKTRIAAVLLVALAVGALACGGWWRHERVKSEELRVKNEVLAVERVAASPAVVPAVPAVPVVPAVVPKVVAPSKPVVDNDADSRRQEKVAKRTEKESEGVQLWENGPYWAECNVGATKPEETGYYFWWGDTVGYRRSANNDGWITVRDSDSFRFVRENCPTSGKSDSELRSMGYIDATCNLVAAHDAATAHLGAPWRMPTDAEFAALEENCTTRWETRNGVPGRLVTGKGAYASKSIFLPAAGSGYGSCLYYLGSYGFYWSSTPSSGYSYGAWYLGFGSSNFSRSNDCRFGGRSVRPVRGFAQ